jgi:hypothetical protein
MHTRLSDTERTGPDHYFQHDPLTTYYDISLLIEIFGVGEKLATILTLQMLTASTRQQSRRGFSTSNHTQRQGRVTRQRETDCDGSDGRYSANKKVGTYKLRSASLQSGQGSPLAMVTHLGYEWSHPAVLQAQHPSA